MKLFTESKQDFLNNYKATENNNFILRNPKDGIYILIYDIHNREIYEYIYHQKPYIISLNEAFKPSKFIKYFNITEPFKQLHSQYFENSNIEISYQKLSIKIVFKQENRIIIQPCTKQSIKNFRDFQKELINYQDGKTINSKNRS